MSLNVRLILFAIYLFYSNADMDCIDGTENRCCRDDLKGYYHSVNNKRHFTECPINTRCSCYFRQKCTMPIEEICSERKSPFPANLSFSVVFNGTETNPRAKVSVVREGYVHEDGKQKKSFKNETRISLQTTSFQQLVLPDGKGSFDLFSSSATGCSKLASQIFRGFHDELRALTPISTNETETGHIIQDWYASDGTFAHTWRLKYNKATGKIIPLFTISEVLRMRFKLTRIIHSFIVEEQNEKYFILPEECENV
ncbi:uncharacterized protein LOC130622057 [Hydractinia symbiolongicarpus]|uniref:uncharacterized protein LOC130622057 n=1 Tax=Hydractinia symbiolongicarpus TaxID=13093 RepID=UPI00254E7F87|nr:uncharacterized protein LOC130622057 [Hydractinia symbiolongicarpus]